MKNSARYFMGILITGFMLTGLITNSVMAQDKGAGGDAKAAPAAKAEKGKPVTKVYFENDHMRIFQITFKPGDAAQNVARPQRILHPLKGGTLTWIYPDGKRDKITLKTGEVKVEGASPPFIPKNEGKTDIVLYNVFLKEPKK
mgnify:CR=1 FL=1